MIQPGKSLGHVDRDYNKPAQDKILAIEQDAPRKKDRGDTDPASLVAAAQTMPNSEAPRVDCTDCN